jgi:hypothetical protein
MYCIVTSRSSAGIEFPGYMIHEAVVWSDIHKKWFFLPRKASKSKYNDVDDERHGTNMLLVADEVWKFIERVKKSFQKVLKMKILKKETELSYFIT